MPRLKGYRFPREVVAYAVWAYHRFALSTADVEDLPAKRGVTVSRETVRKWVNRCCHINCAGSHEGDCVRRSCDARSDLPRVEGFQAVVSDLNCGTAAGGNGEAVAYG